jgi:hypothetical protein
MSSIVLQPEINCFLHKILLNQSDYIELDQSEKVVQFEL